MGYMLREHATQLLHKMRWGALPKGVYAEGVHHIVPSQIEVGSTSRGSTRWGSTPATEYPGLLLPQFLNLIARATIGQFTWGGASTQFDYPTEEPVAANNMSTFRNNPINADYPGTLPKRVTSRLRLNDFEEKGPSWEDHVDAIQACFRWAGALPSP